MLEEKLAKYVSEIGFQSISPGILHILKRNILDSYAGICASLQDKDMIHKFDRLASLTPTEQGMAVWGLGRQAIAPDAIFMNTVLGRRSDLVNTYMSPNRMGGSHPSDNVSLVLSMADWLGKSGKDVLTATYVAYILSCAFADHYDPERNRYDHDAQALFYIPLVIGTMMGLSAQQMTEAQRIAGMFGLDINQAAMGEVTDWKHCTYASCAVRALHSVKLAYAGFTGPKNIYEGEAGIDRFIPHSASFSNTPPELGSIIFKRWPALVFCQTPIDVAVDISREIADPRTIDNVQVRIYGKAIEEAAIGSSYAPVSRAGRTHSIPYCVAAAIIKKTIEYAYFNDDFAEKEKGVTELISKIKITEDPQMTGTFPDGAPCRIIVTLKDGTMIDRSREFSKGDPRDALSDGDLEEKAQKYLSLFMDRKKTMEIIQRVWELEKEPSADRLSEPLKQKVI